MLDLNEIKLKTFIKTKKIYPNKAIKIICSLNDINLSRQKFHIILYVKTNLENKNVILQKIKINLNKVVIEGGLTIIPLEFKISSSTPISIHKSNVWIETYLKSEKQNILKEKYNINVLPPLYIENIINILERKGYFLTEVYNNRLNKELNRFYISQSFNFKKNKNKLELIFKNNVDFTELILNNKTIFLDNKYLNDIKYLKNKIYLNI